MTADNPYRSPKPVAIPPVPGYYRSVFSGGHLPGFDPVAVGIGQGFSQGVVFGGAIGLVLVAMFYWYRSRSAHRVG